ncbi:hypothetical protein N7494_001826 [Penicillium frequentans]|uniref:Zn(2)-C6 fungal-type domain-containing protein n=1 Tax=Penicillium frequentans TaxID=3151616 RepID=A0AAD6GJC1_9EURO|nr:hypothetical protein N7494_001826 [Penicillium glabrum]
MKAVTACQRCRRRKQKCDLKRPNCSNCQSARVLCLTYHTEKQAEIPRDYVSNLEAQIERLRQENVELRNTQSQERSVSREISAALPDTSPTRFEPSLLLSGSPATSDSNSSHVQDLVTSVRSVVVEPSRQPRFLGQSSGISLARLVMASIRLDQIPSLASENSRTDSSSSVIANEASLPPRHAADHLVEVYFQYRTPHLPIVDRSQVNEAVENAYLARSNTRPSNRSVEKDNFIAYIVFAIALCDMSSASGGRPAQSEGCFRSAIAWIEKIITYSESDIETLRCVLLLAQFVALCPSWGSLWHLTGIALRLCIDIGLHWESEEHAINMDPKLLHDRRRLWYSTYQFDRNLCITLGRPFGIIDESTQVQLPNPWAVTRRSLTSDSYNFDIHSQRAHNHMFTLSKLESEVRHVLHSHQWPLKLAYPRVNYPAWLQDIQPRLEEWYNTVPQPSKAHPSSIFACQAYWDGIYNNTILLLYRPNSIVLHSSTEIFVSFEASCKLITSIKTLQREGKIDVMWKWVYHLFMAGLAVIYGLWNSKEIRDRNSIGQSIASLQSCASTLSAMSETFPGASGCRDAFDTLSSATIEWLVTNDAEEIRQAPFDFDKQVKDLLYELQPPPRGGIGAAADNSITDMSGIMSTDNSALCEMLSSAAQWPGFQEMDFSTSVPL